MKNDFSTIKINQLLEEKAEEYVKELREENTGYPLFVYVEMKKNDLDRDYYEVLMYVHTILLEEANKKPYSFSLFKHKGENVFYFFDENKQVKSSVNDSIYQQLKDKNLIKPHSNITKEEGMLLVNEITSWNLFICKDNLEKIEIVKSNYVLESNEKPNSVCK